MEDQVDEVEAEDAEAEEEIVEDGEVQEQATSVVNVVLANEELKSSIDTLIDIVSSLNKTVDERFDSVKSEIDALKETQDVVAKEMVNTPMASRLGFLSESVIGKAETRIEDGRTKQAKDGPKETDPNQAEGELFFQKQGWTS